MDRYRHFIFIKDYVGRQPAILSRLRENSPPKSGCQTAKMKPMAGTDRLSTATATVSGQTKMLLDICARQPTAALTVGQMDTFCFCASDHNLTRRGFVYPYTLPCQKFNQVRVAIWTRNARCRYCLRIPDVPYLEACMFF